MATMTGDLAQTRRRPGYLQIPFRRETYAQLLYVLLALPRAAVSFPLVVLPMFLPLLLPAGIYAWWVVADAERFLARHLLGLAVPAPARPGGPLLERSVRMLRSADTWRAAAYLCLTLPFACLALPLTVGVITVLAAYAALGPLLAIFAPAPWLVGIHLALPLAGSLPAGAPVSSGERGLWLFTGLAAWAALPGGLALARVLASAWGWVVRALLAESAGAQRLREAEAAARRDRSRAEAADRSRRALVVNASHELRTPVAAISAHLESLLMDTEAGAPGLVPDDLRAQLRVAHRESERLGALVDDLLVLARADAGELRLDLGPVAAGEVIAEVCAARGPLARRGRQVTLVHDVPAGLPPVSADRQRLGQVLENLVRNAVTHTPPGGIVSLTLSRGAPGFLDLSVADTGSGIAPEDVDRIFERFYRTDAARARGAGGFGLGLAIVRDLVQAMGGSISVFSTPGEGSTFRLQLAVAGGPDR